MRDTWMVLLLYVKIVDTEKSRISEYIGYTYTLTTYLFWVSGLFYYLGRIIKVIRLESEG